MKKKIIILSTAAAFVAGVWPASAQDAAQVLASVEANNPTLAARRELTTAQTLEARTGNSLENPEVEYVYGWGRDIDPGKAGEVALTQGFDFPTVYAHRNRLARERAAQYGHEYAAYRQQVLFEAQSLCIELKGLRDRQKVLDSALENAQRTVGFMLKRVAAGDAGALDENAAKYQLVAARNEAGLNRIAIDEALGRLRTLNGGAPIDYTAEDYPYMPLLPPLAQMQERWEGASPELLAMVSENRAAERDVKLSRSEALPKLSLGYRYEFSPGDRLNGVKFGVSIPMFGNRNNVKRAKAEAAFTRAQHAAAVSETRTELAALYSRAALLMRTITDFRRVTEFDKPEELLQKALEAGHISITEYYDQLAPLYQTRLTIIDAEKEHRLVCARVNMLDL